MLARFCRHAGLIVAGDLPSGKNKITERECLRIVCERARRAGFDHFVLEA